MFRGQGQFSYHTCQIKVFIFITCNNTEQQRLHRNSLFPTLFLICSCIWVILVKHIWAYICSPIILTSCLKYMVNGCGFPSSVYVKCHLEITKSGMFADSHHVEDRPRSTFFSLWTNMFSAHLSLIEIMTSRFHLWDIKVLLPQFFSSFFYQ